MFISWIFWKLKGESRIQDTLGFDLTGRDSWFMMRFWIFTTEFFCYHMGLLHDKIKQYKSFELSMDQWHLNYMKVILTLWTLNYLECVSFSLHIVHNRANYFKEILFSNFQKNMTKPSLTWLMYLTFRLILELRCVW